MEASAAGLAPAGLQGDGEGAGGDAAAPDFGALVTQMQTIGQSQEQLRSELQNLVQAEPWKPTAEAATPAEPEIDLSFLDDERVASDPAELARRLQSTIADAVKSQAETLVEQRMAPLSEQMKAQQFDRDAQALIQEFPEMEDPQIAEHVVGTTARYVDTHFGHLPPDAQAALKGSPHLYKVMFMAGRAAEAAQNEGGDSPSLHMEGGGGAAPITGQQELGDLMLGARRGASVLPFG